ncbi:MAG: porin [Bacteroidota bacterium]
MLKNILTLLLLGGLTAAAQTDTAVAPGSFSFSGYVEAYYAYDFNKPADNVRPYVYSHNRHNEITANLAFLKATYTTARARANVTLAAGTYMNANYAAEPGVLKNIYEANAGIRLSKKHELWLDAGVLPSHIGFESAYSPASFTLTRSMLVDNAPYYEGGARLSYTTASSKWYLAVLALNGWQRIQRPPGNSSFCGGTQVTFTPSQRISLNYSTFYGNDKPDSLRRTRFFHNVYCTSNLSSRLSVILGWDQGVEESGISSELHFWQGAAAILRYKASADLAIAARAEYFRDENGVIVVTGSPNGFTTFGYSANIDYTIKKDILCRIEGKLLSSEDRVFQDRSGPTTTSPQLSAAICVGF